MPLFRDTFSCGVEPPPSSPPWTLDSPERMALCHSLHCILLCLCSLAARQGRAGALLLGLVDNFPLLWIGRLLFKIFGPSLSFLPDEACPGGPKCCGKKDFSYPFVDRRRELVFLSFGFPPPSFTQNIALGAAFSLLFLSSGTVISRSARVIARPFFFFIDYFYFPPFEVKINNGLLTPPSSGALPPFLLLFRFSYAQR